MRALILTLACIAAPAPAQQEPALEFDVASVKTITDGRPGNSSRNVIGRVTFHNYPLSAIICNAYGIDSQLLVGAPSWAELFEIDAVVEEDPSIEFRKARERNLLRLRSLLEKRFQLQVHRETKILPSYVLVVAKDGAKLKISRPETNNSQRGGSSGHMQFRGQSIDGFAGFLWLTLGRPVFDHTGLEDDYDFDLEFEPDRPDPSPDSSNGRPRPSIFAALQDQLGLKLESKKMPVDLLIVDHVARPGGN